MPNIEKSIRRSPRAAQPRPGPPPSAMCSMADPDCCKPWKPPCRYELLAWRFSHHTYTRILDGFPPGGIGRRALFSESHCREIHLSLWRRRPDGDWLPDDAFLDRKSVG